MRYTLKIPLARHSGNGKKISSGGHQSIARTGVLWYLLSVLIILGAGYVLYTQMVVHAQDDGKRHQQFIAHELARQLSGEIQTYRAITETLARSPELPRLLANGDESALHAVERRMMKMVPYALRVRVLGPLEDNPQTGDFPLLGFADVEMLAAAAQGNPPPVEAHLLGTQQHFDVVQPILNGNPQKQAVGNILSSFSVKGIQRLVDNMELPDGYVEIRQHDDGGDGPLLAAGGNQTTQGSTAALSSAIPGTRWQLLYWGGGVGPEKAQSSYLLAVGGAIVLLMGATSLLFIMFLRGGVQHDLGVIERLAQDIVKTKSLRSRYPVRLSNFKGIIESLSKLGEGLPVVDTRTHRNEAGLEGAKKTEEELIMESKGGIAVEMIDARTDGGVPESIFKAYDIRGIVGDTLKEEIVYDIGRAIGSMAHTCGQQSIVVARDGRLSGPSFVAMLAKGLRDSGRDVIDIGRVPTPLLYFSTYHLNTGSGVMVTGSHNPPEYNGFKIMLGGETLAGEAIQDLRRRITAGDLETGKGELKTIDVVPDYVERVTSSVNIHRPLKLVVDSGNGVAGEVAPRLLKALGCEVTELYCEIDGHFPNHHPDPSQPENLQDLIHTVKKEGADLGLAFDGDGDRLGVVDSSGHIIWPDRQMMLYARDILSRHPKGKIIFDVKCTRHLEQVINEHGGHPLMWKTGHSLIKAKMKKTDALLAGEMSGHIFFKERWYGFDDALYTAARLVEIIAQDPRSSAEVFSALPNALSTPELRVPMAEGEHFAFMQRLAEEAPFREAVVTTIDGVRADFPDGWGLVRASNTTPCLILRFEADDAPALKRIEGAFREIMLGLKPDLSLPF